MKLFIPSKTFLIGEYSVLAGGSAVVACTRPRFEVLISGESDALAPTPSRVLGDLHENAPGGRAVRRLQLSLAQSWLFRDPHDRRGGFGGSTAEWLSVQLIHSPERNLWTLWNLYRQDARPTSENEPKPEGTRLVPSGTDVVAQMTGGLCAVDMGRHEVETSGWPFSEGHLLIFRTGLKLPTHAHLTGLDRLDPEPLVRLAGDFIGALRERNFGWCVELMNQFSSELFRQHLVDSRIVEVIKELRPHVAAVKGCGAMGVDTVVCLVTGAQRLPAIAVATSLGLELVASEVDLAEGALQSLAAQERRV